MQTRSLTGTYRVIPRMQATSRESFIFTFSGERDSELREQIWIKAEKAMKVFTFSWWQMHRCWKMAERRCGWTRQIYSYLFSDRTMAQQSDVSCWWNANDIHFFLLITSKKNTGSIKFPISHNSFLAWNTQSDLIPHWCVLSGDSVQFCCTWGFLKTILPTHMCCFQTLWKVSG